MDSDELEDMIKEIHRDLKELSAKVDSAFTKDEFGHPDFAGHRLYHKKVQETENRYREQKAILKRNILAWAIIGILTIVGSNFVHVYLQPNTTTTK